MESHIRKIAFHFWEGVVWLTRYTLLVKILLFGLSLAGFSGMFTWWFAIGLVVGIIIHEYGHIYVLNQFHIPHKGMFMLPFLGAYTYHYNEIKDSIHASLVSMGGPIAGVLLCAFLFLCAVALNLTELWILLAWTAFLNVLNLLPIFPLDGRAPVQFIIGSVNKFAAGLFSLIFISVAIIASIMLGHPLLLFIAGLTVYDVLHAKNQQFNGSILQILGVGFLYGITCSSLLFFFTIALTQTSELSGIFEN